MPRFKIIIRYMEKKKIIKNKQIIRGGIKRANSTLKTFSSMERSKYIIFFIYTKNFLFITLLFVQESNKNFTVNNSFRIIKRSISFRSDFRQIMSMIFLRGFFIAEGDFDTRSNIKRGHFCQIVSRHLLSGCVKSGIVGD